LELISPLNLSAVSKVSRINILIDKSILISLSLKIILTLSFS